MICIYPPIKYQTSPFFKSSSYWIEGHTVGIWITEPSELQTLTCSLFRCPVIDHYSTHELKTKLKVYCSSHDLNNNKKILVKPSVTQSINQTTHDLKKELIHGLNTELLVHYSSHDLNNKSFKDLQVRTIQILNSFVTQIPTIFHCKW